MNDGRFKPGQSGNIKGRPIVPYEVKQARELTRYELELTFTKYMRMTAKELKEAHNNPLMPMLDLMVIKIMMMSVDQGDQWRLDFLLNRVIGKIPEAKEQLAPRASFSDFVKQAMEDEKKLLDET